jgi:hypothetical protein
MRTLTLMEVDSVGGGDMPVGPVSGINPGIRAFGAIGAVVFVAQEAYELGEWVDDSFGVSAEIAETCAEAFLYESDTETQDTSGVED